MLWLLHGIFGDHSDWLRKTRIELFASERDWVVVMPIDLNSNYANWPDFAMGYAMWDFLTEKLMSLIYNWFPVSDRREIDFDKADARIKANIKNEGSLDDYLASNENIWDRLPEVAALQSLPRLYIACGTEDFFYQLFLKFKVYAAALQLDAKFISIFRCIMERDLFIDGQNDPSTQARKAVETMKTLIVYGTKSGTTENCAHKIKAAMASAEADVIDIRKLKNGDLADYDTVIAGTSVYMGRINGKLKRFLVQNSQTLLTKKLHLFVCSMAQGDEGVAELQKQISADLFRHATQVTHLGCEVHYERLNPLYRSIMRKIVAEQKPAMGLHEQEIVAFAQKILQAA